MHGNNTAGDAHEPDGFPAICKLLIGHCWQRDTERDGAPVWVTGRYVMTAAELRGIPEMDCCGLHVTVKYSDQHCTVCLRHEHADGCPWLADLLARNIADGTVPRLLARDGMLDGEGRLAS